MAVQPSPVKVKAKQPEGLPTLLASLQALYMKAKHYHFNVTGPTFYGDHKTYDGIAEGSLEWFDVIGERMRAIGLPATVTMESLLNTSIVGPSVPAEADAKAMTVDMLRNLEDLSGFCNRSTFEGGKTTENIIQEVDAFLGKQIYFVRSSL